MKNCFIILISVLLINCSSTDKKERQNENKLRMELINDLFVDIVNTNFDKESYDKYRKRGDSLDYAVILIDKFSRIDKQELENEKYFPDSLDSYDYNMIYRKMIDSSRNDTSTIEINRITKTGIFKIQKYREGHKFIKDSTINFVTVLMISTPHFNDKFDKAMFKLSYFCGGTCGSESIILSEKKNDKWIIYEYDEYIVY